MDKHLFEQNYIGLRQIGKGGGSVIYRAYHQRLRQYVVLKQMLVASGEREARREVDILKSLKHSYLPQIYDFVEVGGIYYTVEEYIKGCDLSIYMQTHGRPPEELVLKWLRQMCEVLRYLHGRSIIHSDIKPGNIMIDRGGNICLIDFNISIQQGRRVRGYTGGYCAPEQLQQAKAIKERRDPSSVLVDHRSDIYSTAATFYTLMSGIIPQQDVPVCPLASMRLPEYGEGLCRFVDRGMERDVQKRWQSTGQMLEALAHLDKLTQRYERYVRLRAVVSTCGVLLAAAGILCCVQGTQVMNRESFSQEYTALCESYEQEGATEEVYAQAEEILNDKSYDRLLKGSGQRVQLLTIEGEYASEEGSCAAASSYYGAALEAAEDAGIETENYALNYASALARSGSGTEAERVVQQYCDDDAQLVIRAEIACYESNYTEVLEIAQESAGTSDEIREYICGAAAQAAEELEDWDEAVTWSEALCELSPRDANYRKTAQICMDAGAAQQSSSCYRNAISYYGKLSALQYNDIVNLATAYTLLGEYSKSQLLLDSVDAEDDSIRCRVYYTTAQNCLGQNETDKAKTSCQKAIRCYNRLSEKEKEKMNAAQLNILREKLGVQEELE